MKPSTFGAGLGILVGFLVDGFLLTHGSGWLATYVFPMVVPPLIGAILGGVLGRGLRWAPKSRWPLAFLVILWPVALWFPIQWQEMRFQRFGEDLPVFPSAVREALEVSPIGWDDPPNVRVEFRAKADGEELNRFYRHHLIENGWQPMPSTEDIHQGQWFQRARSTIHLIGFDSDGAGGEKYHTVRITRYFQTGH